MVPEQSSAFNGVVVEHVPNRPLVTQESRNFFAVTRQPVGWTDKELKLKVPKVVSLSRRRKAWLRRTGNATGDLLPGWPLSDIRKNPVSPTNTDAPGFLPDRHTNQVDSTSYAVRSQASRQLTCASDCGIPRAAPPLAPVAQPAEGGPRATEIPPARRSSRQLRNRNGGQSERSSSAVFAN